MQVILRLAQIINSKLSNKTKVISLSEDSHTVVNINWD